MLIGAIIAIAGVGSLIYGITQNNDLEAQMSSVLLAGKANPGTVWIIIGIIAIIIGIAIVYNAQKNKNV
jgi:hypothetical protein